MAPPSTSATGAIDPTTRTLLTQLSVPNQDWNAVSWFIYEGSFRAGERSTGVARARERLAFRRGGNSAAGVVGADGKVAIRKIKIDAIWETACKGKLCPKAIRSSSILRMVWQTVMWSRSSQTRHRLLVRPANNTRTFSKGAVRRPRASVFLVCAWPVA